VGRLKGGLEFGHFAKPDAAHALSAMPRIFAPWGGQFCPQPAFSPTSGCAGLKILRLAECAVIENKDLGCQPQASRLRPPKKAAAATIGRPTVNAESQICKKYVPLRSQLGGVVRLARRHCSRHLLAPMKWRA
jgi:hypothetical protein